MICCKYAVITSTDYSTIIMNNEMKRNSSKNIYKLIILPRLFQWYEDTRLRQYNCNQIYFRCVSNKHCYIECFIKHLRHFYIIVAAQTLQSKVNRINVQRAVLIDCLIKLSSFFSQWSCLILPYMSLERHLCL